MRFRVASQPAVQRLPVALQGLVVAVKNAGLAVALAALLERRLARRHRPGVVGVRGFRRAQAATPARWAADDRGNAA